jgi:hypothetical protein
MDRFSFKSSLVWLKRSETAKSIPNSLSDPLKLNYKYIAHFRPECVGNNIPGLIGGVTFIHDGYWLYNVEKNSYHVRCLSDFIATNVLDVPPLSIYHNKYSLEIGFALVDPAEVLIFTPPIHFHKDIKLSKFIWIISRRISLFIQTYKDPRLIRGISLFVVYDKNKRSIKKKRGKGYWNIQEIEVEQVLDTFGVTPPVFRGYRLGRDGKLIIPEKPPRKIYKVQVPVGRKPDRFLSYKLKIRRRRLLKSKIKKQNKILKKIQEKNFISKETAKKLRFKLPKAKETKTKVLRIKDRLIRAKKLRTKKEQRIKIRNQKIQEQKIRDYQIREKEIREKEIKEKEIKEKEIREKKIKEQEIRNRRKKKLSKNVIASILVLFLFAVPFYFLPYSFFFVFFVKV